MSDDGTLSKTKLPWWKRHVDKAGSKLLDAAPYILLPSALGCFVLSRFALPDVFGGIATAIMTTFFGTLAIKFLRIAGAFREEIQSWFATDNFKRSLGDTMHEVLRGRNGSAQQKSFWETVTRQVIAVRFPALADSFTTTAQAHLFGEGGETGYYHHFQRTITVLDFDAARRLISLRDDLDLTVGVIRGETLELPHEAIINKVDAANYEIKELRIDREDKMPLVRKSEEQIHGRECWVHRYKLTLRGDEGPLQSMSEASGVRYRNYKIRRVVLRKVDINADPTDVVWTNRLAAAMEITYRVPDRLPLRVELGRIGVSAQRAEITPGSDGDSRTYTFRLIDGAMMLPNNGYYASWIQTHPEVMP
jgi:hypothetical protein